MLEELKDMPTISAKVIAKPRKVRFCDGYRHHVLMSSPPVRVYGNAFTGDLPYVMYICMKCAAESDDAKILQAVSTYNQSLHQTPEAGAF